MPPVNAAATSDDRYLAWSRSTAQQARNTGWPRARVGRRVIDSFKSICLMVEPTLSVELGAHQASFSSWMRRSVPDARCVALEANPYVFAQHEEELARAGVEYHHLAAAPTAGEVTLNIPTRHRGKDRRRTNRMASLGVNHHSDAHETVTVPAARGDDLGPVAAEDRVVAWIDVEGAAGSVLPSSSGLLAAAAAVYIEVESESTWDQQWLDVDVARFFEGLGKIPVLRDIERPHQYNVVYLDAALAATPAAARRTARVLVPRRQPAAEGAGS